MAKKKDKNKGTVVKTKEVNKTKSQKKKKKSLIPEKKLENRSDRSRRVLTQVFTWLVFFTCVGAYLYGLNFAYEKFNQQADQAELIVDAQIDYEDSALANQEVLGEQIAADDEEMEASLDIVAQTSESNDEEVDSVVDQYENERKTELREKINLQLPDETDNPNYAVTFVEPNEDGVEVKVDDNSFDEVQSPYLLPSLSIGKHNITIRFQDENDVTQTFTESVIIIPRPPEFIEGQDLSFTGAERVRFEGTALPNSKIVLLISSKQIYTEVSDVDSDGTWNVTFNEEFNSGDHKLVGFVRKDGYASNFSEALNFTVGETLGADSTLEVGDAEDSFTDDIVEFLSEGNNLYWAIGILSGLIIFGIILVILSRRKSKSADPFKDKGSSRNVKKDKTRKDESSIPLREKFAQAGLVSTTKGKRDDSKKSENEPEDDKKDNLVENKNSEESEKEEKKPKSKPKKKKVDDIKSDSKKNKKKKESDDELPEKKEKKQEDDNSQDEDDESKPEVGKVYSKEEFLNEFKELDDDEESAESSVPEDSIDEQDGSLKEETHTSEDEGNSNQSDEKSSKSDSSPRQKNKQSDSVNEETGNSENGNTNNIKITLTSNNGK